MSDEMLISVRFNSSTAKPIKVNLDWTIRRFKDEISKAFNVDAEEINVIFQGHQLEENMPIKNMELGNESVLHAVKHRPGVVLNHPVMEATTSGGVMVAQGVGSMRLEKSKKSKAVTPGAEAIPEEEEETVPEAASLKKSYYVYCKPCKDIKKGKLRVRCQKCGEGTLLISKEPEGWSDVLVSDQVPGECQRDGGCDGQYAEFYFKCGEHESGEGERQAVLPHVVTNNRGVPCIVCGDKYDAMLIFQCEDLHVICFDCFTSYVQVKLNDRALTWTRDHGYSVPCPGGKESCNNTFINDGHYFRIIGKEQFDRYQNFATQEWVLNEGGVLCPGVDCGNAMMVDRGREITCEACNHKFCRQCLGESHSGDCATERREALRRVANGEFPVDPARAEAARWELANLDFIEQNANIKKCPNDRCGVNIEKNNGCMHMTCTACKHDFCWLCMTPWGRGCQEQHWFG